MRSFLLAALPLVASAKSINFQAYVPESFTFDGTDFIVGQLFAQTLTKIAATEGNHTGTAIPTGLSAPAGTVGLYHKNGKVYAPTVDFATVSQNATVPPGYGHVIAVDLSDNSVVVDVDFSDLIPDKMTFLNDVVVDSRGDMYVTGCGEGAIYKATAEGVTSVLSQDDPLLAPIPNGALYLGPNGIEYVDDVGSPYLLIGSSMRQNGLTKFDLTTNTLTEVTVTGAGWDSQFGFDGLRLLPDGKLAGVVYGNFGAEIRVWTFSSTDDWATATVEQKYDSVVPTFGDNSFTTMSLGPDNSLWVLSTFGGADQSLQEVIAGTPPAGDGTGGMSGAAGVAPGVAVAFAAVFAFLWQ